MSSPDREQGPAKVSILAHYRDAAREKLAKVAKKAAKYGQEISWTERPYVETVKRVDWSGEERKIDIHRIEFEIVGSAPRIGDYKFLAELERVPGGVMISAVKGAEIGPAGRNWDGRCEHCHQPRQRFYAYVVENGAGERKIVGKSCLRDHLGMDVPAGLLSMFRFDPEKEIGGEDEGGWGGYGRWEESTLGVIAAARAAIAIWGWRPSSHEGWTTSSYVNLVFGKIERDSKGREYNAKERAQLRAELKDKAEHYYEEAKRVLEWGQNMEPRSDYEHNLKIALNSDFVIGKTFNLVISACAAFDRQVAREDERRKQREAEEARKASMPKSFHVGKVGERLEAVVTVEAAFAMPDRGFGPSTLFKLRSDEGPVLAWFTSAGAKCGKDYVERGQRFKIAFTVKEHTEFRDEAETRVLRVKFIEAVKEAA